MRLFLPWMLATSVLAASALAQARPSGAIRGRVTDDAGRPVSATVSAAQHGEVTVPAVTANATGAFLIEGLAPGAYDVTAELMAHRPTMLSGVVVRAGEITDVTISISRVTTQLAPFVVRASTLEIRPSDPQLASTITAAAIAKLPIGYSLDRALALTPGSRPTELWGGASAQANGYDLDGVSINDPGVGGRLIDPNVNWIEDVQVRGLAAPAEYGDFQGGLVDVVTKSGGNTRRGFVRVNAESRLYNESGFVGTELVPELSDRRAVEGEARGPVIRDRLFYYGSAQVIGSTWRAFDHLSVYPRLSGVHERTVEDKLFGKLTWTPPSGDLVNLSVGAVGTHTSNYGLTGRETEDATSTYSAPTLFSTLSWERQLGALGSIEARGDVVRADERVQPKAGLSVPGISTYQLASAHDYQNAPFFEERKPSTAGATAVWRKTAAGFGFEHKFAAGAELSTGSYSEQRIRTGGMTWRPRYNATVAQTFDPKYPRTWQPHVPTSWGGEERLATDVLDAAQFVQDEMTAGRLTLAPGVRVGEWRGRIADPKGDMLPVLSTAGADPRLGLVLDLSSYAADDASRDQPSLVLKLHVGRYHQRLFGQMFDRAAGSSAYSDQELWEYEGPLPSSPTMTFSVRQRDSLAALGQFTLLQHAELSQVGTTAGLREPYVDQLVAGVEKLTLRRHLKLEAVYVHRTNRNQIALVDRNVATNWSPFPNVQVWSNDVLHGAAALYDQTGQRLVLPVVYVRNDAIIATLKQHAAWAKIDPVLATTFAVPGFVDADTARLTWNPAYALENVSAARRHFDQLQLNAEAVFDRWTATMSLAWSDLEGNLPTVTGYDEATIYGRDDVTGRGPGPFVRPDELIDAMGKLGGYSKLDLKIGSTATLPSRVRVGVFVHSATGDRITPEVELSPDAFSYTSGTQPLPPQLFTTMAGTRMLTATRGSFEYPPQVTTDLHVERLYGSDGAWLVALDAFNVFNDRTATVRNLSLDAQADPNAPVNFAAPLARTDPRQFRLGVQWDF